MKNMIIASTSTVYGSGYLEYLSEELALHFNEVKTILFIPYARPSGISYDKYTEKADLFFSTIDKEVKGIHEFDDAIEAVLKAEAIFIGGGNTFELVNQLYKNRLMDSIKHRVEEGLPYLGTSAGSNVCGISMQNTNDMPIVYPPSFKTLGLIPFNINAHYLDPVKGSTHMGETRETRIQEFHVFNTTPVLGLREGSWLSVRSNKILLKGNQTARLFQKDKNAVELAAGSSIKF